MTEAVHPVDAGRLRHEVKVKYREVAEDPPADFHFHTGRAPRAAARLPALAAGPAAQGGLRGLCRGRQSLPLGPPPARRVRRRPRLGRWHGRLPGLAVGRPHRPGHRCRHDPEMFTRSRRLADQLELGSVEFREGVIEDLPVEDGPAGACASPTSASSVPCPRAPYATSTCGPGELPVPCRAQDGRRSSKALAWSRWSTAHRSTPSPAPAARPAPASTASRATPSGPASPPPPSRIPEAPLGRRRKTPAVETIHSAVSDPAMRARAAALGRQIEAEGRVHPRRPTHSASPALARQAHKPT